MADEEHGKSGQAEENKPTDKDGCGYALFSIPAFLLSAVAGLALASAWEWASGIGIGRHMAGMAYLWFMGFLGSFIFSALAVRQAFNGLKTKGTGNSGNYALFFFFHRLDACYAGGNPFLWLFLASRLFG